MVLYNLTPAQYKAFVSLFNGLAVNGIIGKNEIKAALWSKGITQVTGQELQEIIDSISVDPRGIGFQAFIDYCSGSVKFRDADSEFREAFRIFDRSGDGNISREEISYVFGKVGLSKDLDFDSMFNLLDKNKDGMIQYDEFVDMMKRRF